MHSVNQFFRTEFNLRPLRLVLFVGLFFRLIAAFFSEGYMMSDDHFLVVEIAQGWAHGEDLEGWFVDTYEENKSGRSILYPGLHYLLFKGMDVLGMPSPTFKMLVVRLLHAFYSLLIIFFGFKITERLSDRKTAAHVGLILAMLWMLPILSVRNLVEMVAIPPLLAATWWVMIANDRKRPFVWYLLAGSMLEVAIALRYQTGLYGLGLGVGLLFNKQGKGMLPLFLGCTLPFLLIHGWIESYIAGVPFGKVRYYIEYNIQHSNSYINLPSWNYILLIAGVLIPPVGVFLFMGAFKAWKRYLPLFLGTMFFFAFHSYFPNKQERFMFTMIPMFVILGYMGWKAMEAGTWWQGKKKFIRGSWTFFWVLNCLVLVLATPQSSKYSRIEVMSYLRTKPDLNSFVIGASHREGGMLLPRFYLGKYALYYHIKGIKPFELTKNRVRHLEPEDRPEYIIFSKRPDEDLTERIAAIEAEWPKLEYDTTITGSLIDRVHYKLNPKHAKNDDMAVYRIPW